jgi:hypothetical protein
VSRERSRSRLIFRVFDVTRHAVKSGKSASPLRHHEIANPLETEIEPDDLAWRPVPACGVPARKRRWERKAHG